MDRLVRDCMYWDSWFYMEVLITWRLFIETDNDHKSCDVLLDGLLQILFFCTACFFSLENQIISKLTDWNQQQQMHAILASLCPFSQFIRVHNSTHNYMGSVWPKQKSREIVFYLWSLRLYLRVYCASGYMPDFDNICNSAKSESFQEW